MKHNANILEGMTMCTKGSKGGDSTPQQHGSHHGNQATVHLPGTCQHITERNQCVEYKYSPQNMKKKSLSVEKKNINKVILGSHVTS